MECLPPPNHNDIELAVESDSDEDSTSEPEPGSSALQTVPDAQLVSPRKQGGSKPRVEAEDPIVDAEYLRKQLVRAYGDDLSGWKAPVILASVSKQVRSRQQV